MITIQYTDGTKRIIHPAPEFYTHLEKSMASKLRTFAEDTGTPVFAEVMYTKANGEVETYKTVWMNNLKDAKAEKEKA